MDEKEKYRAEIDARLTKMGETLHAIKSEKEQRNENMPELRLDTTIRKHQEAKAKLEELERTEKSSLHEFKAEMENLVNDIDEDLRKALAYFG